MSCQVQLSVVPGVGTGNMAPEFSEITFILCFFP